MPELSSTSLYVGDENNPKMAAQLARGHAGGGAQAIQFECDTNDEKILSATIKAFQSGSLTPLIKEELRCTIQSRRLAEGKGELKVEFKSPPKKKEMTEEERSRYLKRRVQNREAAQRFRQKQKDTSDTLTAKIKRLERSSRTLLTDLTRLREEKESLREMLKSHLLVCTNQHRIPSLLSHEKLDHLLAADRDVSHCVSSVSSSLSVSDSLSPTGSVSTSCLSATPPPRPDTADSSATGSDVFFFSEEDEDRASIVATGSTEMDTEIEVFVTSSEGMAQRQLQTLEFCPDQDVSIAEEVVIDTTGGLGGQQSCENTDDVAMRLDSCSSVDLAADGRGLCSSTGLSCSNLHLSSFYGSSVGSDASDVCFDSSLAAAGFPQNMVVYSEEEAQKQEANLTLALAESLVSELSHSHTSGIDLDSLNSGHVGDVAIQNGGGEQAGGLAESTSDLRHSLAFAYSRVHDMCDVDLGYTFPNFVLKNHAVP